MDKVILKDRYLKGQKEFFKGKNRKIVYFCLGLLQASCSSSSSTPAPTSSIRGEYLFRYQNEVAVVLEPMAPLERSLYPWEENYPSVHPKITKEFFRCRGNFSHPPRVVQKGKEWESYYDCGGTQKHSLPLRDEKEFIYPILIDLLNEIQVKTGKRVVVTCGHCCPEHALYLDSSPANQTSKHLIGAEVDFYVEGLERQPEKIVEIILAFYRERPKYKGLKEFQEFKRYDKGETNVRTLPWYNKEIFVKVCREGEGRDFDNQHAYPYLSIQVRYDWDLKEKVVYSWEKAFRQFYRW